MVIGIEGTIRGDLDIAANIDRSFICRKLATRLNGRTRVYLYATAIPGLYIDIGIQLNAVAQFYRTAVLILEYDYTLSYENLGAQPQIGMMDDCSGRDVSPWAQPS